MNNSYITIIKEKRTALSRKRIPLNKNGCTANFRIGVPFEQNLQAGINSCRHCFCLWHPDEEKRTHCSFVVCRLCLLSLLDFPFDEGAYRCQIKSDWFEGVTVREFFLTVFFIDRVFKKSRENEKLPFPKCSEKGGFLCAVLRMLLLCRLYKGKH